MAYEGEADRVEAPGFDGEFGVLPTHIPFLTLSRPGRLVLTESDGAERAFVIGAGFAEAGAEQITVLADLCEEVGSYPKDNAATDLEQADADLGRAAVGSADWDDAERRSFLARARLSS